MLLQKELKTKKTLKIISSRKRISGSEVERLVCDNKKLLKKTNWKPKTKFKQGLKITIDWMKKNKKIFKELEYNI